MKRQILFVDDDPHLLDGLRRMLRPLRHEWETRFATSGVDALGLLAQAPSDVVVSDMRMPGIDGVGLLEELRRSHPQIVRIVLSGQADLDSNLRAVTPAHQYLSKPCDAETLKRTIDRALKLRDVLASDVLKRLVAQMSSLPSLPAAYLALMREIESPDPSLQRAAEIVAGDLGMSTKLLQVVNSAFFGMSRTITNPNDAVFLLGLDLVKRLALSASVFSQFSPKDFQPLTEELWRHSLTVAGYAKAIARLDGADQAFIETATTAAMLHDAGKLVLATCFHPPYGAIVKDSTGQPVPLWQVEYERLGASHAEVGAYLLGLWGLPSPLVEAVAWHHRVADAPVSGWSPGLVVHVADALAHQHRSTDDPVVPDHEYLERVGLAARCADWDQACQTVAAEERTA